MIWRTEVKRSAGAKAEPVAVIEVNADELHAIADACSGTSTKGPVQAASLELDLRAAALDLARQ